MSASWRRLLFAALLFAELFFLNAASRHGDFTQPGQALIFVPLILLSGLAFLGAARWFPAVPTALHPRVLWAVAIGLRLIMLPCAPGDDFWRYPWEGRVQLAGQNPYVLAPNAPELQKLRDPTWPRINHPEVPAIYPPLAELTFAALAGFSPSPIAFKLLFITADLLTLLLLRRLVSTTQAAWYAWNPAVAYAFAGAAHYDSLMLLAVTGAIVVLRRGGNVGEWASVACLGAAIALKFIPIFLLPVWAFALRGRAWKLLAAVALPLILTIPFGGPSAVLGPLGRFADVTRFNELLVWIFPNPWQRNWPVTILLVIAVAVVAWRWRDDWPRAALWVLGTALVLSPVLHPWYATWILPLAVWRRQLAWTVLSISTLSALLLWESTAHWTAWQPNLLTRAFVVVPPLLVLAWQTLQRKVVAVEA